MDIRSIKIGAPKLCPRCDSLNPSGRKLPDECMWCGSGGGKEKMVTLKITAKKRLEPISIVDEFRGPCEFCDLAPMGEHCVDCKFYVYDLDPEFSKVVSANFWELF
jgi:hypothetical protein